MLVSVVVPAHNAGGTLARCLDAIAASAGCAWECIVVDDCSTDASPDIAARYPVHLVQLAGGPFGPAYARNRGAELAAGGILLFVDADVMLHPDAMARATAFLASTPSRAAVFGSYDDSPDVQDFISQYKNLTHHFVHQQGRSQASTFWSGCGAIRRDVFLTLGGFDEKRYPRPCIEDIELGGRVRDAGYEIGLEYEMQGKHLKRWSLWGLLKADVRDRVLPWTALIHQRQDMPNDLNLSFPQRLSALAVGVALVYFAFLAPPLVTALLAGLITLFLLTAGYWNWSGRGPAFEPLPTASRFAVPVLVLACAVLSWRATGLLPLLPLGVMLACMALGRLAVKKDGRNARLLFSVATLAWALTILLPLLRLPLRLILPAILLAALAILINQRLYRFFARERGPVFALAAVPFQFLYYIYSIVAFAIGSAWYLLIDRGPKRSRHPYTPLEGRTQ